MASTTQTDRAERLSRQGWWLLPPGSFRLSLSLWLHLRGLSWRRLLRRLPLYAGLALAAGALGLVAAMFLVGTSLSRRMADPVAARQPARGGRRAAWHWTWGLPCARGGTLQALNHLCDMKYSGGRVTAATAAADPGGGNGRLMCFRQAPQPPPSPIPA